MCTKKLTLNQTDEGFCLPFKSYVSVLFAQLYIIVYVFSTPIVFEQLTSISKCSNKIYKASRAVFPNQGAAVHMVSWGGPKSGDNTSNSLK